MFAKNACISSQGMAELKFENNYISAKLSNATLKSILDIISEKKGVWHQSDEKSLDEKITLNFVNLRFYDGLRRILSKTNYVLVYDINKVIVGIFITSKSVSIEKTLKRNTHNAESDLPRLDNEIDEVPNIDISVKITLEEEGELFEKKAKQTEKNTNNEVPIRPDDYEWE